MDNSKKICIVCEQEKDIAAFYFRKDTHKHKNTCLECEKIHKSHYYESNKIHFVEKQKEYKLSNRKEIDKYQKNYNHTNSNKKKEYRRINKEKILINNNKYAKNKYKTDPVFRIREIISKTVYRVLKSLHKCKGSSIIDNLPYSIQELKEYIEKQFEPWMMWNNQGKYNIKTWDDNNPLTWTWQIDHIIPHSDLQYSNMSDENFQKCWALQNLRPLNSKQNLLDGVGRIRHGITRKKTTKKNQTARH